MDLIIKARNILLATWRLIQTERRAVEKRALLKTKFPNVRFDESANVDNSCIIGDYSAIKQNTELVRTILGRYCFVADSSRIYNTTAGNFTCIGPGTKIGLGKHPSKTLISIHPSFYNSLNFDFPRYGPETKFIETEEIKIGSDVWIGANCIILDGVKIGHGAIIAAGAIVTKDVDPYSIVGGIPARLIRMRFDSIQIQRLLDSKWWDLDDKALEEWGNYFSSFEKWQYFSDQKLNLQDV